MAFMREGIMDSRTAWAQLYDYEKSIKTIGFKNSPFYSLIQSVAPSATNINIASGHEWYFDKVPDGTVNNFHAEGSEPAEFKTFHGEMLKNHYQIVKTSFGVSGTDSKGSHVNGENKLAYQRKQAVLEHTISLEKILLSDQKAEARSDGNNYIGKAAGIKSFLDANNTIDAVGQALGWKDIRELLKIGFLKGGSPFTHIMMNAPQKDALDDILFAKTTPINLGANNIDNNVTVIGNTPYGSNIKVILNPYLEDNEVIAFKPAEIYKVNWRAMHERDIPTSKDALLKEIVSEFTLRVSSPFSLARIKNLKAA